MIRIAICDDESIVNKGLKKATESFIVNQLHCKCQITSIYSAKEMMKAVSDNHYDLIEMDIELDHSQNGIQLAKKINEILPETQIIFVTAYHKYYFDVYDANHIYFVEKYRLKELLPKALKKAVDIISEEHKINTITLKYKGEQTVIKKQSILFIEKRLRMAEFNLEGSTKLQAYMSTDSIINLLENRDFVRIHRSFIINMRYVVSFSGNSLIMANGRNIPIGNTYLKEFQQKFIESHQNINNYEV